MVEDNPRDVGHEMDGISIVYGDETLPRLYENSRISTDQLPGQQGQMLFMVIAYCLNGLTVFSYSILLFQVLFVEL